MGKRVVALPIGHVHELKVGLASCSHSCSMSLAVAEDVVSSIRLLFAQGKDLT